MNKSEKAARELESAGFLKEDNIEQAADILAEPMSQIRVAWEVAFRALDDGFHQEEVIAKASQAMSEFDTMMEFEYEAIEREIIEEALDREEKDEAIVLVAKREIVQVSGKAAESLVSAGLVEAPHARDAAVIIARSVGRLADL